MKLETIILTISTTVILLATNLTSQAQSPEKSKLRFGIGVDGLFSVGHLRTSSDFGLGITPRLQYGLSDNVALTFTSGLYHFFPKDIPLSFNGVNYTAHRDFDLIPVKLGFKSFISRRLYIGVEVGMGFQVDNGGGDSKFLVSGGIGYATKKWDIGIRYENISADNYRNGIIGLRLAYGFGL